jgi:DNA-directed RNA polymerase I, II, and III subunit RPABC1
MDTDEQTRLFRVWKTIHGMLNDRGYVIAQANLELTIEGFREKYDQGSLREMLTLLASKRDDPQCRIYVFFIEEAKITIPILNKYAKRM